MPIETAAIVAGLGLIAAVITAWVNHYRSILENHRIQHERQKWLLDLHGHFEKRLHEIRLEEYPAILSELERLSHFRIQTETPETLRELAAKLNAWGYGKAGLCMSENTRMALFKLRYGLVDYINEKITAEELMTNPRTDLIEWLRRDASISFSTWRSLPSLLSEIQKASAALAEIQQATTSNGEQPRRDKS